ATITSPDVRPPRPAGLSGTTDITRVPPPSLSSVVAVEPSPATSVPSLPSQLCWTAPAPSTSSATLWATSPGATYQASLASTVVTMPTTAPRSLTTGPPNAAASAWPAIATPSSAVSVGPT